MSQLQIILRQGVVSVALNQQFVSLSEFKPSPKKIVNILPVLRKEWELSFDVIIYGKSNQNKNGIFTMANKPSGLSKVLNIFVTMGKQLIQIYTKDMIYSFKFNCNEWINIKLTQRISLNECERIVFINSQKVKKTVIAKPKVFENLICFAGSPDHLALNGLVRNFTFKQDDLPKRKISLLILKHLENFLQ